MSEKKRGRGFEKIKWSWCYVMCQRSLLNENWLVKRDEQEISSVRWNEDKNGMVD